MFVIVDAIVIRFPPALLSAVVEANGISFQSTLVQCRAELNIRSLRRVTVQAVLFFTVALQFQSSLPTYICAALLF